MQPNLTRVLEREWHSVRQIRLEVSEALADMSSDVRHAAIVAASELMENAVKYGETVPGIPGVAFVMEASLDRIRLEVVNGSTDSRSVDELQDCVRKLSEVEDLETLYVERLQEMVEHPDPAAGKLGLYRIAFEAGFRLQCTYERHVVTVTATKGLQ